MGLSPLNKLTLLRSAGYIGRLPPNAYQKFGRPNGQRNRPGIASRPILSHRNRGLVAAIPVMMMMAAERASDHCADQGAGDQSTNVAIAIPVVAIRLVRIAVARIARTVVAIAVRWVAVSVGWVAVAIIAVAVARVTIPVIAVAVVAVAVAAIITVRFGS